MKILFISRAFPPVTGGIENMNYELSQSLPKHTEIKLIANKGGKKMLPIFLPWALVLATTKMRNYDALLLGDGVLGIVGAAVKALYGTKKKVICITHGLDLTFKSFFYQNFWVKKFIPASDKIIAVGNQTIIEGVKRGIKKEKFIFIPNGVNTSTFSLKKNTDNVALGKLLKKNLAGKKVLMTGGRLVKRKGAEWFVRNVLPVLPDNIIYAISGDGPARKDIDKAINESAMQDRAVTLGYVTDEERLTLLQECDLFIQPNIPVDGDMEGFGLVVLEAGSAGIPVVVSRLEGLKDAIHEGKNGFLVEHSNADAWKTRLTELLSNNFDRLQFGKDARDYITQNFTWDAIAKRYVDAIKNTTAQ